MDYDKFNSKRPRQDQEPDPMDDNDDADFVFAATQAEQHYQAGNVSENALIGVIGAGASRTLLPPVTPSGSGIASTAHTLSSTHAADDIFVLQGKCETYKRQCDKLGTDLKTQQNQSLADRMKWEEQLKRNNDDNKKKEAEYEERIKSLLGQIAFAEKEKENEKLRLTASTSESHRRPPSINNPLHDRVRQSFCNQTETAAQTDSINYAPLQPLMTGLGLPNPAKTLLKSLVARNYDLEEVDYTTTGIFLLLSSSRMVTVPKTKVVDSAANFGVGSAGEARTAATALSRLLALSGDTVNPLEKPNAWEEAAVELVPLLAYYIGVYCEHLESSFSISSDSNSTKSSSTYAGTQTPNSGLSASTSSTTRVVTEHTIVALRLLRKLVIKSKLVRTTIVEYCSNSSLDHYVSVAKHSRKLFDNLVQIAISIDKIEKTKSWSSQSLAVEHSLDVMALFLQYSPAPSLILSIISAHALTICLSPNDLSWEAPIIEKPEGSFSARQSFNSDPETESSPGPQPKVVADNTSTILMAALRLMRSLSAWQETELIVDARKMIVANALCTLRETVDKTGEHCGYMALLRLCDDDDTLDLFVKYLSKRDAYRLVGLILGVILELLRHHPRHVQTPLRNVSTFGTGRSRGEPRLSENGEVIERCLCYSSVANSLMNALFWLLDQHDDEARNGRNAVRQSGVKLVNYNEVLRLIAEAIDLGVLCLDAELLYNLRPRRIASEKTRELWNLLGALVKRFYERSGGDTDGARFSKRVWPQEEEAQVEPMEAE